MVEPTTWAAGRLIDIDALKYAKWERLSHFLVLECAAHSALKGIFGLYSLYWRRADPRPWYSEGRRSGFRDISTATQPIDVIYARNRISNRLRLVCWQALEWPNMTSPAEKIKRRNSFRLIAKLLGSKHFVGDGPENFLPYEKFLPILRKKAERKKALKNHNQKIKFMNEILQILIVILCYRIVQVVCFSTCLLLLCLRWGLSALRLDPLSISPTCKVATSLRIICLQRSTKASSTFARLLALVS